MCRSFKIHAKSGLFSLGLYQIIDNSLQTLKVMTMSILEQEFVNILSIEVATIR